MLGGPRLPWPHSHMAECPSCCIPACSAASGKPSYPARHQWVSPGVPRGCSQGVTAAALSLLPHSRAGSSAEVLGSEPQRQEGEPPPHCHCFRPCTWKWSRVRCRTSVEVRLIGAPKAVVPAYCSLLCPCDLCLPVCTSDCSHNQPFSDPPTIFLKEKNKCTCGGQRATF